MEINLEMPSGECDDQMINEGLEFESKEEAFKFYKEYAKSIGFNTIIKASRRSRMSGKFIDAKFVCTRYGTKKTSDEGEDINNIPPQARKRGRINRSSSKTDCKACLHVKKRQDGKWVIRSLVKEHNHETSPGQTIPIRESCGREKIVKSRKFEDGDVERLLSFFTDMQAENPFFFYAVDQTLRNVFWVDAKGRLDYTCFCDVVSVDTTFIKNEYKLPLVAFIGVNHHGQFLLLGCGLLFNEESKSGFVWLFKSWLKAMHGCEPRVILTKHDQTLKEAVSEALPASRHCFYMWDTLGQMSEKLGHVMRQEKGFVDEINEAVYSSCKGDEFEKRWWEVVDRFNVRDNVWLHSLCEDREYWVPVYIKDVSLAGMCTEGGESVVFDKYVQRKTTLKVFLDQYKTMIQERYEEEERAEIETLCKQPGIKSPSPFGKQMAEVYTREMFKRFQVEVLGGVACHPKIEDDGGDDKKTFRVQDYEQNRGFVVVWSSESSEVVCSCRLFELKGFLCRHAMIVLQMSGELTIPSKYVLKRWMKDARRREAVVESDVVGGDCSSKAQRYRDLCFRSLKLSEEASLSEESYNAVMNALSEALRSCEITSNVIHSVEESDSDVAQNASRHDQEHNNNNSFNENVADTGQEHALHEVWKETALQEQRNRYSILDDYLSTQQMSHEMGQINMMATNRNGYCTAHQNIHSLGQSITQQRHYGNDQLNFRPEVMYERLQDMGQTSFRRHPQQHCESSKQQQQSNKNFSH